PMIIIGSVVMSLNGVLLGLVITQTKFSIMMTGMGIISLAGVVVNNAIVLIDYIDRMKSEGFAIKDALVRAGMVRFRPVILTAVTTVLGMTPMAIGVSIDFKRFALDIGSEDALWWGPMAQAVIFGLLFATGLTLILVPVMYYLQEKYMRRIYRKWARRKVKAKAAAVLILAATLCVLPVNAASMEPDDSSAGSEAGETDSTLVPVPRDTSRPVITLTEAKKMALAGNPGIKTLRERLKQANYLVSKAWSILLPTLDANASWTRNDSEIAFGAPGENGEIIETVIQEKNSTHYGVNASITVFNARAYPLLKYAYQNVDFTDLSAGHAENELLVAVVRAYYQVEAANRAVDVAKESLRNAEEFLKLSLGLNSVGQATRIDVLRAESQMIDARNLLLNSKDAVEVSKTALAALIDFTGAFDIASPGVYEPVSTNLDELLEKAWFQRKDLESERIKVQMNERLRQDILCQWIPRLSVNYGWQWNSSSGFGGDNDSWNVELSAYWSILEGGARRADYLNQKSEILIAQNNLKQLELDIHQEIDTNLQNLNR
ncbi:MAG TPA: efflux RND transporter permease subunit, partial [bacterium]|nr:efflux RND transporter permease subunit [bacterium]